MTDAAAAPLLEARELACVRGDRQLFQAVSFALSAGELVRIAGPNGAGKTSLLRILCGLASPESGEVFWRGLPLAESREAYFEALVYIGHAPALKDDLTAIENLRSRLALAGHPLAPTAAHAALEALGVGRLAELPARHLSQGQRRRVTLARLAVSPPAAVWILDEPFAALDIAAIGVLEGLIGAHLDRGGIALVTTHQEAGIGGRAVRRVELGVAAS